MSQSAYIHPDFTFLVEGPVIHLAESNYTVSDANCHDITRKISPHITVYYGDPKPSFESVQTLDKNGVNISRITLGSHTGTHIDAPRHFIAGGNTVENESLGKFIGEAIVVDVSKKIGKGITEQHLADVNARKNDIVLIYTGTGHEDRNFSYLEQDAARWIINRGIKCVGIDTLSVEKYGSHGAPVHKLLLGNSVGIIENLDDSLGQFVNGRFLLVCLCLPFEGLDGSPARAILFEIIK